MKRKFNDYQGKSEKQIESSQKIFFYCFTIFSIFLIGYGFWKLLEWVL